MCVSECVSVLGRSLPPLYHFFIVECVSEGVVYGLLSLVLFFVTRSLRVAL